MGRRNILRNNGSEFSLTNKRFTDPRNPTSQA